MAQISISDLQNQDTQCLHSLSKKEAESVRGGRMFLGWLFGELLNAGIRGAIEYNSSGAAAGDQMAAGAGTYG
jgi:hypothetical protein